MFQIVEIHLYDDFPQLEHIHQKNPNLIIIWVETFPIDVYIKHKNGRFQTFFQTSDYV
jgi:hypothetical protein